MPYCCPECETPGCLNVANRIELPPDIRSDAISFQTVECSQCDFAAIAVYEESRRGALDRESFDYTGYYVSADDLESIKIAIGQCPQPDNWRCLCPAHHAFGTQDASGRWNGLSGISTQGSFELRL